MSVINQKYAVTYPAQANGQVNGGAVETNEPSPEKTSPGATLILEWFWLLTPAAGAGQAGQRLRAHWRLK